MFDFNFNFNFDLDGDGVLDSYAEDLDGDGIIDTIAMDTNSDGMIDTIAMDTNHDGMVDTYHGTFDTDGDGIDDTIIEAHDYNQDEVVESITMYRDSDNNGIFEEVIKMHTLDENDSMEVTTYLDMDEDGNEDFIIKEQFLSMDEDGTSGIGNIASTYVDELENFDPENADMDCVSGNPEQSMKEWEYQGDTGRCALYSQKFVIEELTNQEIDMEELARFAEEQGWFSEDSGTPLLNMNKVLEHYGVSNEMSFHNEITDIEECLKSGGKIIVAIDADEIWYGERDDLFTPCDGPNHAVEVIGIDRTNPEEPMVILNDSGSPNGCGEMVPLETFLDAWEDGNCQMIACM